MIRLSYIWVIVSRLLVVTEFVWGHYCKFDSHKPSSLQKNRNFMLGVCLSSCAPIIHMHSWITVLVFVLSWLALYLHILCPVFRTYITSVPGSGMTTVLFYPVHLGIYSPFESSTYVKAEYSPSECICHIQYSYLTLNNLAVCGDAVS